MLKQKFSDIFRRDKKQKGEEIKKQQPIYFNQSYFDCKLAYNPHKLSLIKVIANISVGPDAGMPMMVNCKWLIKKNSQYSQIQGVTSSCYQPCIQDVGCSILVQITPLIQGKIYSGALITKQTGPLELGSVLQTQFTETKSKLYYQKQSIQYCMKVQAVFGKETQYSNLQYPQDGKLIIRKHEDNNFQIEIVTSEFKTYFWITKQFPTTQFIRKSYNSVVISFTEYQSMRLAFKEAADREIIGLLLRTLTANSTLDWPIKQEEILHHQIQQNKDQKILNEFPVEHQFQNSINNNQENVVQINISQQKKISQNQSYVTKSPQQEKITAKSLGSQQDLSLQTTPIKVHSQSQNQSNSKAVEYEIKIGELNIQLNKLKKQLKDLMKNYNIEKQNKCKLQIQVKKLSDKLIQFDKMKKERDQLLTNNQKFKQDNRFYRNEVTILNKNLKKAQLQLQVVKSQKDNLQKRIEKQQKIKTELKMSGKKQQGKNISNQEENWRKFNDELAEQNQQLKREIQRLQNILRTANKKIESLHHQKSIGIHYSEKTRSEPNTPLNPKQNTKVATESNSDINKQYSENEIVQKQKIISNLQFKISNLEMLLKYKSGQKGNESLAFHKIINNLTEQIRQKQEQLQSFKKVNKQLMEKMKKISNK